MIRLAIAGTGSMASYHMKKFSSIADCRITACKDHLIEHSREFAQANGIEHAYSSISELLSSDVCDALSCAVVDSRHSLICTEVLQHSLSVFCEKPMARTVAEAEVMAAAAGKAHTYINFSKRNAPALGALKELVDTDRLGRITECEISYLQSWVSSGMWGDWRTHPRWKWRLLKDLCTGGVVGDLGSHVLDTLMILFHTLQVDTVCSTTDLAEANNRGLLTGVVPTVDLLENPVIVDGIWQMTAGQGIPVTIRLSTITPNAVDDFSITVTGTRAVAQVDLATHRNDVKVVSKGDTVVVPGSRVTSTYQQFISSCLEPQKNTDPLFPDFAYGLKIQRLLDAMHPGGLPV